MASEWEHRVSKWLEEEIEDDEDVIESDDDGNAGIVSKPISQEGGSQVQDQEMVHDHVTNTIHCQQSSSEDDIPLPELRQIESTEVSGNFFISRNGTRWNKSPLTQTRVRAQNIRSQVAGPIGIAKNATTPLSCFELFFDESILEKIVLYTNIYIESIKDKYQRERDVRNTDLIEIRALIGLLLGIGVSRSGRRNLKDYWDNSRGTGLQLVYCTMSINRFRFLLRALRFDDINSREERRITDKLAPIRDVIDVMEKNCRKYYIPTNYLTLDEQLVRFRGRCGFIVYIPNKPDKFGIKLYMVADTEAPYVYNFEVYAGAQPNGPYELSNKVNDVVLRLLEPLNGIGCNVTMNNYFTTLNTSLELLQKKITVIGTLKANRPEIPEKFKASKTRPSKSSIFGFQPNCTLVSYSSKKNKAVSLLSTMHYDDAIDSTTGDDKKPEIVDKMCKQYSVMRNSRRWPLTLWFNFLNIAGINALIIYQYNKGNESVVRRNFLYDLAFDLAKPLMLRRIALENLPRELKFQIKILAGVTVEIPVNQTGKIGRVGKCYLCSRARNRSTKKWCNGCGRWICPEHQVVLCIECNEIGD